MGRPSSIRAGNLLRYSRANVRRLLSFSSFFLSAGVRATPALNALTALVSTPHAPAILCYRFLKQYKAHTKQIQVGSHPARLTYPAGHGILWPRKKPGF